MAIDFLQKLRNKAVRLFNLRPTELPLMANVHRVVKTSDDQLTAVFRPWATRVFTLEAFAAQEPG